MRQACRQAAQELHLSGDPLKAVVAAVSSLEVSLMISCSCSITTASRLYTSKHESQGPNACMQDAPLGNAGVGSNLTVKGVVQCDASTMAGDGAFGAVGAVSGALKHHSFLNCYRAYMACNFVASAQTSCEGSCRHVLCDLQCCLQVLRILCV